MQANPTPWHFLVNPAAGGGRSRLRWRAMLPELRAALPGMTFAISTPATSLGALARDAVQRGKTRIVGVGGDGTHHDILNALVTSGKLGAVVYAPLSIGTGNDWVRSLGIPTAPAPFTRHLLASQTPSAYRTQLIGRLELLDTGETRYFLNVAGFAYDAEVVRLAAAERVLSPWRYPALALGHLRKYRAPAVSVAYDGGEWAGPVHTVNVGVGKYSGGGMRFVPHADPFGAELALTIVPRTPAWRIVANSWRLYDGSIGKLNGAQIVRARSVTLRPRSGVLECEADGEWLGSGAVRVSLSQHRLRVV